MDPRDYRDARWHSLLRAAGDLGLDPERAAVVVERVLERERRRIRRAADPDPLVRQALHEAVLGPPAGSPHRRGWPVVAGLALALAAVGIGVALTRPQPPPPDHLRADQMPSLFGYDGVAAGELLARRGLEVELRAFRSCEVRDRVVASEPAAGTRVERGDQVVVYTSVPADVACLSDYADRELAWQLLDFANERAGAPSFAARVALDPVAGTTRVLNAGDAADPASWEGTGILSALREASTDVALVQEHPLTYAVPAVRVVAGVEDAPRCGASAPTAAAAGDVMVFLVRPADRAGCPLRVEVHRDRDRRIDGVALYPASS